MPGRRLSSLGEALSLEGAAGRIEALVAVPAATVRGIAVLCHPHPLFGGAMTNKVVHTVAGAAVKAGFAVARFNFRGVGASQGRHDEGRGETDDTLRVVAWMRERYPGRPLLLGGFSFGAFVSLKAAVAARPALQVSIAPPFKYFAAEPRPPRPAAPWLVVHGDADDVVDYGETRTILETYAPRPELVTLAGAGHFFHGRLRELETAVNDFLARHPLP